MNKKEAVKILRTQGIHVDLEYLSDTAWFSVLEGIQKAVKEELHPDIDIDEYGEWDLSINLKVGRKHIGDYE